MGAVMEKFGLALAIAFAVALAIFGVTYPIVGNAHIAEVLAALPLAGCHHIAELLERREARHSLSGERATSIHSIGRFAISFPLLVAYGSAIVFAICMLAGSVTVI